MSTRTVLSPLAAAVMAALVTALVLGTVQLASGGVGDDTNSTRAVTSADFYTRTQKISCPDGGGSCSLSSLRQQLRCKRNDLLMSGNVYLTKLSDGTRTS